MLPNPLWQLFTSIKRNGFKLARLSEDAFIYSPMAIKGIGTNWKSEKANFQHLTFTVVVDNE